MASKYCCLSDEVKVDNSVYGIDVCVSAPNGETVDEFMAARVIGIFKKMLDADFEAERDE